MAKSAKEEYEKLSAKLTEAEGTLRDASTEEEYKEAKKAFDDTLKAFQKAADKYFNEKVTIRLFKDNGEYSDDVYVGWNSRSFQIKRGVDVEVPRGVAEIIRESEEQAQAATMTMQAYAEDFETETKKRNL